MVLSQEYKESQNEWDEGIFAYEYWDYDVSWHTALNIGAKVKQISDYMFSGVRLQRFWIPMEVKSIGYKAFHDCEHLYEVTLGHTTPPTLGDKALDECILTAIAIKVGTRSLYMSAENWKDLPDEYDNDYLYVESVK